MAGNVTIGPDMFVQSDEGIRKAVDTIVFVRGKVEYDHRAKNPISYVRTSYGVAYKCVGLEKRVGASVERLAKHSLC